MATKNARETSADRWSSWRRAATVSVTPAGTRLYRVVTCDAERIIGLDTTQLPLVGSGSVGDLLAYLDGAGCLRVREYQVAWNDLEGWSAEPAGYLPLFSRQTIWIAPFDPDTDLERLADAA
jgi:hypothetical protein